MKTNPEKFIPVTAMKTNFRNFKNPMGKLFLAVCAGLVVSALAAPASRAAAVVGTKLHGHVPAAVSQLKAKGSVVTDADVRLAIGLPLRNSAALTNLLKQIYDPSSTNYHRFLTPEEFTARFGPTEQEYAMVVNFARVNGLTVTATHPNRLLLDVSGKPANIKKAFQVNLKTYRHPTEARDFFAPDAEPSVPASLPILRVSGLDNYSIPHPHSRIVSVVKGNGAQAAAVDGVPAAGSAPGGNYQGADFRNAYVPGTTLTGAGQSVGLLQFDGFYASDIAAYETQIGLTNNLPNLVVVPIDGGVPVPTPFGNGEVSLDIEMVLSMSPGVSNIYVYEAPNPSPWVDLLSRMANDNLAKQLSCSWGGGSPDAAAEQIFQQMALQGQSFFNAVGDSCAFTSVNALQFPEDSPHITQVGGTRLTTGGNAAYQSETVWNWGIEFGPGNDGIGSSGGISPNYSIPTWQTNVNMPARGGSSTMRNMPDVALTADHVWVIYGSGQTGGFGGTSCAAPLWAGFMALVNQQATNNGLAPIGFLNPAIYKIATNSVSYTNCFHDTTTGNNTWSGSPNLFYATNNYDLATGLGTPNGTNLINALTAVGSGNTSITHYSPPPPPYGSTLASMTGGNPNGTWQLYVLDDAPFNSGVISNGWILKLITASPVGFSANLELLMSASASSVLLGSNITYTLTLTNYGPSTSSNVLVADTLPFGVNLISTNATAGTTLTRSGQQLNWTVGTLATNDGAQLVVTVQSAAIGNIVNYAQADAETADANPGDNFASVQVAVTALAQPLLAGVNLSGTGSFRFDVISNPGVTNIVQASTNLVAWVPIYTNLGPFTFTNLVTTNYPFRFYRVVVP